MFGCERLQYSICVYVRMSMGVYMHVRVRESTQIFTRACVYMCGSGSLHRSSPGRVYICAGRGVYTGLHQGVCIHVRVRESTQISTSVYTKVGGRLGLEGKGRLGYF